MQSKEWKPRHLLEQQCRSTQSNSTYSILYIKESRTCAIIYRVSQAWAEHIIQPDTYLVQDLSNSIRPILKAIPCLTAFDEPVAILRIRLWAQSSWSVYSTCLVCVPTLTLLCNCRARPWSSRDRSAYLKFKVQVLTLHDPCNCACARDS